MKNFFGGIVFVAMFAFISSAFADSLPGENTQYCEAKGLSADSFIGGTGIVGIYDGNWNGRDSSTLVLTKVGGSKVKGWYAYGPKQYCEEFSGNIDVFGKIEFTASWGQEFVLEAKSANLIKGKYSWNGDNYADFVKVIGSP